MIIIAVQYILNKREFAWGNCLICQKDTNEHLRYPMLMNGPTNPIDVNDMLLKNIHFPDNK